MSFCSKTDKLVEIVDLRRDCMQQAMSAYAGQQMNRHNQDLPAWLTMSRGTPCKELSSSLCLATPAPHLTCCHLFHADLSAHLISCLVCLLYWFKQTCMSATYSATCWTVEQLWCNTQCFLMHCMDVWTALMKCQGKVLYCSSIPVLHILL